MVDLLDREVIARRGTRDDYGMFVTPAGQVAMDTWGIIAGLLIDGSLATEADYEQQTPGALVDAAGFVRALQSTAAAIAIADIVRSEVYDWAEADNASPIPASKLTNQLFTEALAQQLAALNLRSLGQPAFDRDSGVLTMPYVDGDGHAREYTVGGFGSDSAQPGDGLTQAQVLALFADWARASSTAPIPDSKLPSDLVRTATQRFTQGLLTKLNALDIRTISALAVASSTRMISLSFVDADGVTVTRSATLPADRFTEGYEEYLLSLPARLTHHPIPLATFNITAGASGTNFGYVRSPALGALRSGSPTTITRNERTYTLERIEYQSVVQAGTPRLIIGLSADTPTLPDFAGLSFGFGGGGSFAVADAALATDTGGRVEWTWSGLTRDVMDDAQPYDIGIFQPAVDLPTTAGAVSVDASAFTGHLAGVATVQAALAILDALETGGTTLDLAGLIALVAGASNAQRQALRRGLDAEESIEGTYPIELLNTTGTSGRRGSGPVYDYGYDAGAAPIGTLALRTFDYEGKTYTIDLLEADGIGADGQGSYFIKITATGAAADLADLSVIIVNGQKWELGTPSLADDGNGATEWNFTRGDLNPYGTTDGAAFTLVVRAKLPANLVASQNAPSLGDMLVYGSAGWLAQARPPAAAPWARATQATGRAPYERVPLEVISAADLTTKRTSSTVEAVVYIETAG